MFVIVFLGVVAFMLTNGKDALSEQVNNLLNKKEETYEESRVRHPNITRLDVDVYGRFENSLDVLKNPLSTIKLAENTKTGTAYHEAFHTVFWVIIYQ